MGSLGNALRRFLNVKNIYNTLPEELKLNYTRNIKGAFDSNLEKGILLDPFVKEMILDIDKSEVIAPNLIESPILGAIPPMTLSGGVKALVVLYSKKWDLVLPTHLFGNNCAKWLLRMSDGMNIYLYTTSYLKLPEELVKGHIISLNDEVFDFTKDEDISIPYDRFFRIHTFMHFEGEVYEGDFR